MLTSRDARAEAPPSWTERALFVNLSLLNIVQQAAKDGVEITRVCFRRTNSKALEQVLFRCYQAIEGKQRTAKEFKGLWPLQDKAQTAGFYQKVGTWLQDLRAGGRLDGNLMITVSALRTNTSTRCGAHCSLRFKPVLGYRDAVLPYPSVPHIPVPRRCADWYSC
jgi:hypothetical protein